MMRQHLPASHKITIVIKGSEKFISNSTSDWPIAITHV